MLETKQQTDFYLAAHEEFERLVTSDDPAWLRPIRNAAIAKFAELGFPSRRDEDWKYTYASLAPLLKTPFKRSDEAVQGAPAEHVREHAFSGAIELVFVNGRFSEELSDVSGLPDGVVVTNLATAIAEHRELVEPHLARYAQHEDYSLTALNTAFLRDGVFIHVKANTAIEKPIHILHYSSAPLEPVMTFPRHLIVTERSSQVTVVETYVGGEEQLYFNDSVVEVFTAENATVDHYKVLRESNSSYHVANLQVFQQQNSNFSSHYIALAGGVVRNESRTLFDGENSECTFNGLYIGAGNQHIDNHTVIDHAKPHCNSYELYKGLLDDKAKGVFNGKIFVRPDAQKTDAKQTNQALLLSDDATIDTKPQLEIFADDVKCTHGATVGQLDETSLFYLRSRGIGMEQAKSLLTFAFANDIIQRIKVDAIRNQLEDALLTRQDLPRFQEL
ncbi:MAG: Fe-S cluster assembly protein SufD [Gemmataceae bacterium]